MEMTEVLADRERRRGEQPGPRIGFAHALEIVGNFDRRCVEAAAAYQRFDPAHFLAVIVLPFQYVLQAFREADRAFACLRALGVSLLERRQQVTPRDRKTVLSGTGVSVIGVSGGGRI